MQKGQRRPASAFVNDVRRAGPTAGGTRCFDASWPNGLIRAGGRRRKMVSDPVEIVRVYDDPGRQGNEYRVLVDRLWPRGRSRDAVDLDQWVKDATPSTELRRWYGHDPKRFPEFSRRYRAELALPPGADVVSKLREASKARRVVLLTATRDVEHSGATVLRDVIVGVRGS